MNQARSAENATRDDAATAAGDLVQRARKTVASTMTDAAGTAAQAFDGSRSAAADGLDTAASALYGEVGDVPGREDRLRTFARATADRLSTGADYVRSHDAARMMADVETFVRGNPGPALAVAAAFGFLLGRSLSRD